jgi:uncharacterized membrane protein
MAALDTDSPIELDEETRATALERVILFSDAVFAIAITLLVIDLRIPDLPADASSQAIADALRDLAPRYIAFFLSFAVIGAYWLTHWRRFQLIKRLDQHLVVINMLLLGSIAFIPFPTALIAEFGDAVSTTVYALAIVTTGVLGAVEWLYAERAGFIDPRLSTTTVRHFLYRILVVPGVFLASLVVLVALGPRACQLSWLLIPVAQMVVGRIGGRAQEIAF